LPRTEPAKISTHQNGFKIKKKYFEMFSDRCDPIPGTGSAYPVFAVGEVDFDLANFPEINLDVFHLCAML
jgi:hypothetical protein